MCDFCGADHKTPSSEDIINVLKAVLNVSDEEDVQVEKLSFEGVIKIFMGSSRSIAQLAETAYEASMDEEMTELSFYFNTLKSMQAIKKMFNYNIAMVEEKVRELAKETKEAKEPESKEEPVLKEES